MISTKDTLLGKLRSGEPLRGAELFKLIMLMSLPAILAQLSMCLMSYIDAAMVGRLGSAQAAAVGLMSSSTWLFGSFCYGNSSGFTVQIAHRCGAGDYNGAKRIFRKGLFTVLGVSLFFALIALAISGSLPHWLRGGPDIIDDARAYFRIYTLFLPVFQLAVYCESALIASGN
ncbi:MAG: MATE family efflux transporter, partial [Bacteroidales bacterium]|nr:MATE family efflux transporter [Bacteroidales bacterium]